MKYFVMLAAEGTQWDELSPEEQQADMERLEEFDRVCAARDGVTIVASEALDSATTSTTVRISQTRDVTITDGPFAEAAEQIGAVRLPAGSAGSRYGDRRMPGLACVCDRHPARS